ncbi:MAG: ABC transporter permease [Dehalogenimonas sp.]
MWHYAWRETVRHKWRAAGNIFGYLISVATMIVLVSVLNFSSTVSGDILTTTGTHFIAFQPECFSEECSADLIDPFREGFTANGSPARLLDISIIDDIKSLPTVADAAPVVYFEIIDPGTDRPFTIIGLPDLNSVVVRTTTCSASDLVTGRFLDPGDKNMVMVEEAYAYAQITPAGLPITIGGEQFTVAGIINTGIRPAKADIYMTMNDAFRVINSRLNTPIQNKMNIILVESASSIVHPQAMKDVQNVLGQNSLISTYGCFSPAAAAMGINENGLRMVTIIITLAVIIFAIKSQYSSVIERRYDIGIMKAIGWSDRKVIGQLLYESFIQGATGGIIGVLAGIAILLFTPLGQFIDNGTEVQITVSWIAVIAGFCLATLGGIIAGIIPGLFASRLKPADILRRL